MEKEQGFDSIIKEMFDDDEDIREFINSKCMRAITECEEYLKAEYSGIIDDDELSIIREKECFKSGFTTGFKIFYAIQKYSKKI